MNLSKFAIATVVALFVLSSSVSAKEDEKSVKGKPEKPEKDNKGTCAGLTQALADLTTCKYFDSRTRVIAAGYNDTEFATAAAEVCSACGSALQAFLDNIRGCPSKIVDVIAKVNNDITQLAGAATWCQNPTSKLCAVHYRAFAQFESTQTCGSYTSKQTCLADATCAWTRPGAQNSYKESSHHVRRALAQQGKEEEKKPEVQKPEDEQKPETTKTEDNIQTIGGSNNNNNNNVQAEFKCSLAWSELKLSYLCHDCVESLGVAVTTLYEIWKKERKTAPKGLARAEESHTINAFKQMGSVCKKVDGTFCMTLSSVSGSRDESAEESDSSMTGDVQELCSVSKPASKCLKAYTSTAVQAERTANKEESEAAKGDATYKPQVSTDAQDASEVLSQLCRKDSKGNRCGDKIKNVVENAADTAWLACKAGFGDNKCNDGCGALLTQKIADLGCCKGALNKLLKTQKDKSGEKGKMSLQSVGALCSLAIEANVEECPRVKANKATKISFPYLSCAALSNPDLVTTVTAAIQTGVATSISANAADIADVTLKCATTPAPAPASARANRFLVQQSGSGVDAQFTLVADDPDMLAANMAALNTTLTQEDLQLLDALAALDAAGYDASIDYSSSQVGATGAAPAPEEQDPIVALSSAFRPVVCWFAMVLSVLLAATLL